jgi:hypothetical protein
VRRLADAIRVALRRPVGRRAVGVPVPVV